MGSFYDVVTGNLTKAADLNQLVDALNGSVASGVTLLGTSSTANVLTLHPPSAPASDTGVSRIMLAADTQPRVQLVFRADGYGGIYTSAGTSVTGTLYGNSSGWVIDQSLAVTGNITGSTTTGIPTNRNAAATSVPIYTGTTTPTSPPTGSVWIKA